MVQVKWLRIKLRGERGDLRLVECMLATDKAVAGLQVVEVVGEAAASTEQTQLLLRQKSAGVSDNVSAETIGKTTDSNVASAVVRALAPASSAGAAQSGG